MKVLIVEDDPQTVEAIQLLFAIRMPDAEVSWTPTGAAAPRLVRDTGPDLVLLDLGLPDVHGLVVLKEIRRFSDVPVIVVTAVGEGTGQAESMDAGADDYIVKPFYHRELLEKVEAVIARRRPPPPGDEDAEQGS